MDHISTPSIAPAERPVPPKLSLRRAVSAARQALIVLATLGVLAWLGFAIQAGLARNGIAFDMGFLLRSANFDIAEGWVFTWSGLREFVSSDTNAQALLAGLYNTIKTSVLSIVLATVLGVALGLARISRNWLLRQLAFGLVEAVRNTPMLIQLVFWYFAVMLKMPALTDAATWFDAVILSQSGIFLPGVKGTGTGSAWAVAALVMGIAFVAKAMLLRGAGRRQALASAALLLAICAALGLPFTLTTPTLDGMAVLGATSFSPEFAALLLGLSVYTAAFIAEIVRGAVLALPRGQWEAASALGLGRSRTMVDVVLPQVYRVVLPAFGNQYISLAKTTSLGIAIGYADLFNVYGTVANQSGRNLEGVIVVMLAYLVLSWTISAAVNLLNNRMLRQGGAK